MVFEQLSWHRPNVYALRKGVNAEKQRRYQCAEQSIICDCLEMSKIFWYLNQKSRLFLIKYILSHVKNKSFYYLIWYNLSWSKKWNKKACKMFNEVKITNRWRPVIKLLFFVSLWIQTICKSRVKRRFILPHKINFFKSTQVNTKLTI